MRGLHALVARLPVKLAEGPYHAKSTTRPGDLGTAIRENNRHRPGGDLPTAWSTQTNCFPMIRPAARTMILSDTGREPRKRP